MGMIVPSLAQWLEATGVFDAPGIFVTGTDTGVGKTHVGVQLIHALRVLGREVIPRKPVESGWLNDEALTDAGQLAQAAGVPLDKAICPYRFQAALAPPRAASRVKQTLLLRDLAATCPLHWDKQQFLHVEGAGGFYSPLANDGLNADLAQILGLPVVLVAEDRVGCINQVLLVAEAIKQRHLQLAGVILNVRQPPVEGMDNLTDLLGYLNVPLLRFPFNSSHFR
ncbi:dethiobiotin synthase [Thiothrix lacustris]|uniref:ATP-dependent dethiobiotin synthetase BioD n=1 Tax=Thiothrix lacustris TaxID=525917 RepID=A0ABY9MLJ7_9GAMM|nr:dethiobiotin synthase [Thiothrix lacustris]WML89427.1 dethiobiotin synthase [Thiothrix lacustris]